MSTPANHKTPASKPFCFDFAKRNTCTRGDKRNFPHVAQCKDFALNKCPKGDKCKYAHLTPGAKTPGRSPSLSLIHISEPTRPEPI
eukprot:7987493-Pyramimonas_sp.AAC.1